MLKQKYFLADIFILSAEKQPIKLSWRKIEWLLANRLGKTFNMVKLYAINKLQPAIPVLYQIADILNVDVRGF